MNLVIALVLLNAATFLAYYLDKRAAMRGGWRISEATLLVLGFLGGTLAAIAAQQIVRHKNRKRRFQLAFWAVTGIQLYLLWAMPFWLQSVLHHLHLIS